MKHQELKARAANGLTELADQIHGVPEPQMISFQSNFEVLAVGDKPAIVQKLKASFPSARRALYAISVGDEIDRVKAWKLLKRAKRDKVSARAYSRVLPFHDSPYLYVGSSKQLPKRLLEHFGFGARTTYALHLSHWASKLVGSFSVEAFIYEDIDQAVLCALEDQMSADLQPMFGRRGSL